MTNDFPELTGNGQDELIAFDYNIVEDNLVLQIVVDGCTQENTIKALEKMLYFIITEPTLFKYIK